MTRHAIDDRPERAIHNVNDRLPEKAGRYSAIWLDDDDKRWVGTKEYDPKYGWGEYAGITGAENVTHWSEMNPD